MPLFKKLTLCLLLTCVSACASSTDSYCKLSGIITVSDDDKLTETTAKEIYDHDELYKQHCGKRL